MLLSVCSGSCLSSPRHLQEGSLLQLASESVCKYSGSASFLFMMPSTTSELRTGEKVRTVAACRQLCVFPRKTSQPSLCCLLVFVRCNVVYAVVRGRSELRPGSYVSLPWGWRKPGALFSPNNSLNHNSRVNTMVLLRHLNGLP